MSTMTNKPPYLLSILIPTVPSRVDYLAKIFDQLQNQQTYMKTVHPSLGTVEIVVDASPRFLDGGPSIGKKRQNLVQRADGKYLCFLDDDDSISPNYIESLVRMCSQGPDIVTYNAIAKLQTFWALIDMRLDYKLNDQLNPNYTARRPPWHISPVLSKFAKLYEFKDKNNAEDFEWMERVLMHCTTEVHTDKILFQYNHGDHSEADQIPLP